MSANSYMDTADLVGAIRTISVQKTFFLDRYFIGDDRLSTKEEIVFDEVLEGLPVMAPFVSPDVAAKPQKQTGYVAKSFKPAYVKPLHTIKPRDFIKRRAGEGLNGEMTPEERMDATILELLEQQKTQIKSRWEWMAAQAIINGSVKVEGEDYPTQIVDFGRDDDNTIVISDTDRKWSNQNADIGTQLEDWSSQILSKTGYAGKDIIMSTEAWREFRKNKNVRADAELRRGITNIPSLEPQVAGIGGEYKGLYGAFAIYEYTGNFREQDGKISRLLQPGEVVMTCPPDASGTGGVEGIRAFGAILDLEAMIPLELYPTVWDEKNPSHRKLMTQSAPLMIPGRPNATIKAKVL